MQPRHLSHLLRCPIGIANQLAGNWAKAKPANAVKSIINAGSITAMATGNSRKLAVSKLAKFGEHSIAGHVYANRRIWCRRVPPHRVLTLRCQSYRAAYEVDATVWT